MALNAIAEWSLMADQRLRLSNELADGEEDQLIDALARPNIRIVVPNEATTSERAAAVALYAMCCRVFPNVVLDGDGPLPINPWAATTMQHAKDAQPCAPAQGHSNPQLVIVSVGSDVPADFYMAGDDWNAVVATSPPDFRFEQSETGGLGLQVAACLVFGEIFKRTLSPLGFVSNALPMPFVWNLVNYRQETVTVDASVAEVHPVVFAGAGSLASATVAGLVLAQAEAEITVVDDDLFDQTHNPYRYVAATNTTTGSKADWLRDMCYFVPGIHAVSHRARIEDWSSRQDDPGWEGTVVVTADRVDARRHGADLLARHTISGGVDGLSMEVHRSSATGSTLACSYCAYVDVTEPADQVEVYESLTGLPSKRLVDLISGSRLTKADVDVVVAAGRIPESSRSRFIGRRLEDLVREAYGEAAVRSQVSGDQIRISAPHVAWLTGMIIAAELVKESRNLAKLGSRVRVDLRGAPLGITDRPGKDLTGRCLCHDPSRIAIARVLYPA